MDLYIEQAGLGHILEKVRAGKRLSLAMDRPTFPMKWANFDNWRCKGVSSLSFSEAC